MAVVRFHGQTFTADPVQQTAAGDWLMRSREHTGRLSAGSMFLVKPEEIVEMTVAETPLGPIDRSKGLAALEKAMAAELESMPRAADLIKQHQANLAEATKPPGRPMWPRQGPNPT